MEHLSKLRAGANLVGPVKLLEWAAAVPAIPDRSTLKHREMTDQSTITMCQSDFWIRQNLADRQVPGILRGQELVPDPPARTGTGKLDLLTHDSLIFA